MHNHVIGFPGGFISVSVGTISRVFNLILSDLIGQFELGMVHDYM